MVVTCNLTYILFLPFVVTSLRFIDSGGQNKILLVPSSVPSVFLFFFLSFLGAFSVISALSCYFLGGSRHLSLGVVSAMIFHCSLSLDFVCGRVRQLISSRDLLIGLSYVGT